MSSSIARDRLTDIFGPDLTLHLRGCSTPQGKGLASLGCLRVSSRPEVYIDDQNRVRIEVTDSEYWLSLPVTDLRMYAEDQVTPRAHVVEAVAKRIRGGVEVLVCVGLTRPWQKPGDPEPLHWLQVNNLHLADAPIWQDYSPENLCRIDSIPADPAEHVSAAIQGLLEHLRAFREVLAAEQQMPAYVIAPDAALRAMAERRPQTLAEIGGIPGMGPSRHALYGPLFRATILSYSLDHGLPIDALETTV